MTRIKNSLRKPKGFTLVEILVVIAIVVVTMGEMLVVPTSQSVATNFAPEDMRGRYMGVFGMTWMIPATFGPGLAGIILDNYNPNLLWLACGVIGVLAAAIFILLHLRFHPPPISTLPIQINRLIPFCVVSRDAARPWLNLTL